MAGDVDLDEVAAPVEISADLLEVGHPLLTPAPLVDDEVVAPIATGLVLTDVVLDIAPAAVGPFVDRPHRQHELAAGILPVEPPEPAAQETDVGERVVALVEVRQQRLVRIDGLPHEVTDLRTTPVKAPEPQDRHRLVKRRRARLVEAEVEDARPIGAILGSAHSCGRGIVRASPSTPRSLRSW